MIKTTHETHYWAVHSETPEGIKQIVGLKLYDTKEEAEEQLYIVQKVAKDRNQYCVTSFVLY